LPTAILSAGALVMTILFAVLGARPPKQTLRPRRRPWTILMIMSFVLFVALASHLIGLLQDPTGSA